jgi:hypothetical protein
MLLYEMVIASGIAVVLVLAAVGGLAARVMDLAESRRDVISGPEASARISTR